MPQRSPIARFALELFEHALESYVSGKPRDRKIAVLNLAQTVELATKAALVEKNVPIFDEKGASRSIGTHEALAQLAKLWGIDRIPGLARLQLLIDERNAIQHRYGHVDEVTIDYHMQTVFGALGEILSREFDTDLHAWIRANVNDDTWRLVRFVETGDPQPALPSAALVSERSATLDFVDGFARYERAVRDAADREGFADRSLRSTLDAMLEFLANLDPPPQLLIEALPNVYRLRNQVIHGQREALEEEVRQSLKVLDGVVERLRSEEDNAVLRKALSMSVRQIIAARMVGEGAEVLEFKPAPTVDEHEPGVGAG